MQISRDLGQSWHGSTEGPKFSEGSESAVKRVWHISPGHPDSPGVVYVGTSTGQLFYSRDEGDTWELLMDYLPPINSVECTRVA